VRNSAIFLVNLSLKSDGDGFSLDGNNLAAFWRVPVATNGDGTEFLFLD
jgi:hypothetical protein